MKTAVLSRRRVLQTLIFSTIAGITSRTYAGGILARSNVINWLDGCFMPRQTSPSFESACSNVLAAIQVNQRTFKGAQTTFEYTNDLPNGTIVEQLMVHKQAQGILSFETKTLGLGSFLEKLNGILHNPAQEKYWRLKINGIVSQSGISQAVLNTGDTISFTLGSALNDEIVFVTSLGDYTKVLTSHSIPLWKGRPQTINDWPLEYGSTWYEFCQIIAPQDSYFIPNEIVCTKYIERWDVSTQSWVTLSVVPVSTSENAFIGQSWDSIQETSFSQRSVRMIFGGTGTGFSPLPTTSEMDGLTKRLIQLRSGKVRIRIVIKVSFYDLNGNLQIITSEKFSLKEEVPFLEGVNPLQISSPTQTIFTAPAGQEGMLYEIESSSDLKNWNSGSFISNQPSKVVQNSQQFNRQFWRVRRF